MTQLLEPPSLKVRFDTPLHGGQREVLEHPARFKVLACGRRWGKTMLAGLLVVSRALSGGWVWYVAPDYKRASRGWRQIKQLALQIPGVKVLEADRRIEFPGAPGGWLEVRSAHDENALRGEGLHLIVVDEGAFIRESTWNSELRPALADQRGDAFLVSTFQGENYFYELYERGQDPAYPEWMSWRFPTLTNPFIDPQEVEDARSTTPQAEFEQEWEANPLVYVGAVFPGEKVQDAAERACEWRDDLDTFAGLDWGYTNATAFEVCQESAEGHINWLHENLWVATDLEIRLASIVETARRRKIRVIYADAAGADQNASLKAALRRAGVKTEVIAVPFGKYKDNAIVARRWYLEQGLESMSPEVPQLIRTTKRYHYKEGTEDVAKEDDHPVDAATAFYASRRSALVTK